MWAIVAMGANLCPRANLRWAIGRLADAFPCLRIGRIYRTPPEGVRSWRPFLNGAVLLAAPGMGADALKARLASWEIERGRRREHPRAAERDRPLDLDLVWTSVDGWRVGADAPGYLRWPVESLFGSPRRARAPFPCVGLRLGGRCVGRRALDWTGRLRLHGRWGGPVRVCLCSRGGDLQSAADPCAGG